MNRDDASAQFNEASRLYQEGRYEEAWAILEALGKTHNKNHRLVSAQARTLGRLGRFEEALLRCERLEQEFHYEKAAVVRESVEAMMAEGRGRASGPRESFRATDEAQAEIVSLEDGGAKHRFRIKPVRLLILGLLLYGMATQRIPYWVGGGLLVLYFGAGWIAAKLVGSLLYRLFSVPFKMKGRALAGATAEVHEVRVAEAPESLSPAEEEENTATPLQYYHVDVTITPPAQSDGFKYWEPGELAVAMHSQRIKSLDDHEFCFQARGLQIMVDGEFQDDEGLKFGGPQRVRLRVGLPQHGETFKFVYYLETFGEFQIPLGGQ